LSLKKVFEYLFSGTGPFALFKNHFADFVKQQTGRVFGKASAFMRQGLLGLLGVGIGAVLASWGVIFLPLAIILCVPWSWQAKILFCVIVSLVYMLAAYIIVRRAVSVKEWMKKIEAGDNGFSLPAKRKRVIREAKIELRRAYHRQPG